ncbi:hypothetical protein MHU86_5103 [Fragilaria crotonensis]|nr:hypothetical protein MHU86_5103 [Fragilaria crotonensis]
MMEDEGAVAAYAEKQLSKRGPAFTSAEDIIVAKAFIAASENAICGAHQRVGSSRLICLSELYKNMTVEQTNANKALLEQSSHATREEYLKKGIGNVFPPRSPESIFNRFKGQILAEVMKYMAITETTEMASGWSIDDHKTVCLGLFKDRYGRAFDFFSCYEYLKDKNKLSSYRTKCDEEKVGLKRPIGKKQARQTEHDAKLIKAIVSEVVVKKEKQSSGVRP